MPAIKCEYGHRLETGLVIFLAREIKWKRQYFTLREILTKLVLSKSIYLVLVT